uniref:Uncharacterized protein n=1 Tax=Setaria viridis TaxID=4556 RepID=A0A4U6U8I5_SETVI|nr:hypothetical protein SEVIR_6G139900v2 [Setaria viridis]
MRDSHRGSTRIHGPTNRIKPSYQGSIGLYALMCACRPCYSIYLLCIHTMYRLVDLYHGIGSIAMFLVAPTLVTIARDSWSVVKNARVVLGLFSIVGYGFAPRVSNGRRQLVTSLSVLRNPPTFRYAINVRKLAVTTPVHL